MQKVNPNAPTLGYWKIRGLAQGIRYQLIYQGVEFNEVSYEEAKGENIRAHWHKDKYNLGLEFPNLPYFIDGNVKMTETLAIHQYIADKWDPTLLGNTPKERAHVMMMAGIVKDLKMAVTGPMYGSGSKDEVMAKVPDLLPPILKYQGKNKFLCTNDKPTYVDFWFFELIQALRWVTDGKIFQDYQALKYYYDEISALPNLNVHLTDPDAWEKKVTFNFCLAKLNGKQNW